MGFIKNIVRGAVRGGVKALGSVASGLVNAVQSVASTLASTTRQITGAVYDQIGSLAQKIGNTVEQIASNPKMLAAVAVNFAFPGAGTAIGEWILGAKTAAAVGSAATAAVGNACLNTAMNGGDMQKGITTAVTSYIGNVGAKEISEYVKNATNVPDALAKNVGTTTSYAAIQAAMGKDPTTVLLTGGATACAQLLTQQIPGFDSMPQNAKDAITRSTAAALQNKSGGVVNAAIDYATNFARDEYKQYKAADDAGFNYDVQAYKDAQAIGITKPEDYYYAKQIGANNPNELNIAKNIGAEDYSDLSFAKIVGVDNKADFDYARQIGAESKDDFNLAKTIGLETPSDLNYAKTIGATSVDEYDFAKNINAQNKDDFDLAKTLGLETPNDLNFAKQLELNNKDDFNLAKNIGAKDITDLDFAKTLGLKTADDLDYAKMIGVQNADEYDFAKKIGVRDATDLAIAEKYDINDKKTLSQYADFLGHGTETASTTTFKNKDGSEVTIDNEANIVKYTIPTPNGPLDVTKDITRMASKTGGYEIIGDDGSRLTINPDGTVTAQEAPDENLPIGATKPEEKPSRARLNAYNVVKSAEQNRAQTTQSEVGGINEATLASVQRNKQIQENPLYALEPEELIQLYQAFYEPESLSQTSQDQQEPSLANVQVGGEFDKYANYLDSIGEKPDYLRDLSPTRGDQQVPGEDTAAPTKGGYTEGPPIGGGGGAGNERQVYGGPLRQSAPTGRTTTQPYGYEMSADTASIEDQLRAAGLQDQSDAETQRLLNVQGPMAIGQAPRVAATAGLPAAFKPPVAPTVTLPQQQAVSAAPQYSPDAQINALAEQIRKMQESSSTGLQQLQQYAAQAAKTGGMTAQEWLRQMMTQKTGPGTTVYKDAFGNYVTRYGK